MGACFRSRRDWFVQVTEIVRIERESRVARIGVFWCGRGVIGNDPHLSAGELGWLLRVRQPGFSGQAREQLRGCCENELGWPARCAPRQGWRSLGAPLSVGALFGWRVQRRGWGDGGCSQRDREDGEGGDPYEDTFLHRRIPARPDRSKARHSQRLGRDSRHGVLTQGAAACRENGRATRFRDETERPAAAGWAVSGGFDSLG
jgi:hypothetical protein